MVTKTERTKLNVAVGKKVWTEFLGRTDEINIRRDAYLEDQLLNHIGTHEKRPEINHPKGTKLMALTQFADDEPVRIRITVQKPTVERLNELCRTKNLSRDVFVERVLRHANEHLEWVAAAFSQLDWHVEHDHFEDLYWTEGEVKQVVESALKSPKEA